ncbi:MAG: sugar phosphate isomerase/epimerase [Lachnospiraceae bacterium]|nr:sugar phosphate isomerase/epimerase [Lachnospiraceae bacterium]
MGKYEKISGFADEITSDLTGQLELLKKLDIHFVEMRGVDGENLIFHTDEKVREIRSRLDDAGVKLSAMGTPLGKIGITEPFEKHFEDFKRAVEIAHMMDVRNMRMFSFYVPQNSAGNDPRVKDEVFARLNKFADYAKAEDVVLLHENEKDIYGEMAAQCKELMDEFYGDHFKAIFDFANFVQAGQDTLEAYEMLKDYVVYIHVKDAIAGSGKVVPVGYGDGHVKEIFKRLFASGYDGFLSLEPHLSDFTGFAELEKGDNTVKDAKPLSGPEAFTLAYDSLLRII